MLLADSSSTLSGSETSNINPLNTGWFDRMSYLKCVLLAGLTGSLTCSVYCWLAAAWAVCIPLSHRDQS